MKVLFIDSVHPILWERLENNGYTCIDGTSWKREKIIKGISGINGVVIRSKFTIDKEFLDQATSLKFITRSGAGLENIDINYAKEKNVQVFNSPEGNRDAVGEQAIGMLLSLFNNLNRADQEVRQGLWKREENRGIELKGKTVGIIGYGNMGQAFAQRLRGFDCRVIAYDKYKTNFSEKHAQSASLEQIFEETDILSLHVPLTSETQFMVNENFIQSFQKNIFIINTARGKVLKTDALVQGLNSGKIKGACLDVLEYESNSFEQFDNEVNVPDSLEYIRKSDKVILSPHVAGWTFESYVKLSDFLAQKVLQHFGSFN